MFFIDPLFLLFMIPGLIIAGMASAYTHSTFSKYKQFGASSGMTGAQAAQRLLASAGIYDVRIECVGGFLSDHYDPTAKVLRLSPDVYSGSTISAIGVACHEAGHAIQHATAYGPLGLRSALVPLTSFASFGSYIVITIGFLLASREMILLGAILFGATVLFAIVTLPVEWDASARAKKLMVTCGIVTQKESEGAGAVLNAAFMTYVASALSSLLMLVYYLLRAGVLGGSDD
ncbi:MAG: zinc metallopeptidase [Lentisphaerae bacterium]|nr:zinc metallopeptidase [Lentisphaerota bacterium]